MREIIFRGLRTDGKGWVYGSFLKELYNSYIVECVDQTRYAFTNISVIPETVGQFTGLTDKNGAKIWEGDRLRIPADLWIGDVSVGKNKGTFKDDAFVEYYGGSFRINQIGNDSKLYYGVIDMSRNTGADVVEVIGTIHDNPELIRKEVSNG